MTLWTWCFHEKGLWKRDSIIHNSVPPARFWWKRLAPTTPQRPAGSSLPSWGSWRRGELFQMHREKSDRKGYFGETMWTLKHRAKDALGNPRPEVSMGIFSSRNNFSKRTLWRTSHRVLHFIYLHTYKCVCVYVYTWMKAFIFCYVYFKVQVTLFSFSI